MSKLFDREVDRVLQIETGRYTNDPADPGGPTKWGVSEVYWPQMAPVKDLTRAGAIEFYRREFWRGLDQIDEDNIASKVFRMAVNFGYGFTIQQLQEACNELGAELDVDGKLGPNTLTEVNYYASHWNDRGERLFGAILIEQGCHYKTRKHRARFYAGWSHRMMSFLPDWSS